jgi:hypothetical protein
MNLDQVKNVSDTMQAIADHLTWAWNYVATLRSLQHYTRESPAVLDKVGHFIATIHTAIWYALFLKLSHCSDIGKDATGFPKLFKQLQSYLPKQHKLFPQIQVQKECLGSLDMQKRVKKWRDQVIAHHTNIGDFSMFYKANVVPLDEIELSLNELNKILHVFSIPLCSQIFMVTDLIPEARKDVDLFVTSMKKAAGASSS